MSNKQYSEFIPLKDFENDYEIQNEYPFVIRKKANGKILKERDDGYGYIRLRLNLKHHMKHVLIAKQFLPNPNNLPEVDHINRNRADYHLENLRWTSKSTNNRNKTSHNKTIIYEYFDSISNDAIKVEHYNNHEFADYYYHDNFFYYYTGIQYRKLYINTDKYDGKFVRMQATNNKFVKVYYTSFKKMYDIPI
mgnify:FL=1